MFKKNDTKFFLPLAQEELALVLLEFPELGRGGDGVHILGALFL